MSRFHALAAGLLLALAVVPASAAGGEPSPPPEPAGPPAAIFEVEEVYVYDVDRKGRRIGPRIALTRDERESHRVRPDEAAAAPAAASMKAATPTRGLARLAGSGCRGVDAARVGRSLFGFVTYKFWQHKDWCWTYPRVTGANSYYWLSDVDPNWIFRGLIASWGDFYNWCCGVWNSGHVSFRQGQFENCIFHYGCLRTEYPWVKIFGHSDGGFSYDTGA